MKRERRINAGEQQVQDDKEHPGKQGRSGTAKHVKVEKEAPSGPEAMQRAFIFTYGGCSPAYYVEWGRDTFSIRPVTEDVAEAVTLIVDNPMLRIMTEMLESEYKRRGVHAASSISGRINDWGITRDQLTADTLSFDAIQSALYVNVSHPEICEACGGLCCTDLHTSGAEAENDLVGPLRLFEIQFHKGNYRWVNGGYRDEYCAGSNQTPYLLKPDGACVYYKNGCTAEKIPLMCSQFSCLSVSCPDKVRDKLTGAQRTAGKKANYDACSKSTEMCATRKAEVQAYYRDYPCTPDFFRKLAGFMTEHRMLLPRAVWCEWLAELGMGEDTELLGLLRGFIDMTFETLCTAETRVEMKENDMKKMRIAEESDPEISAVETGDKPGPGGIQADNHEPAGEALSTDSEQSQGAAYQGPLMGAGMGGTLPGLGAIAGGCLGHEDSGIDMTPYVLPVKILLATAASAGGVHLWNYIAGSITLPGIIWVSVGCAITASETIDILRKVIRIRRKRKAMEKMYAELTEGWKNNMQQDAHINPKGEKK